MSGFDIAVQWTVFAGVAAILAMRHQLTPFHPTTFYLIFHAIVFCVRPTLIYSFGFDTVWNYMLFTPEAEHLERALLLSSTALVTLCLFYCLVCHRGRLDKGEIRELTGDERRAFFVTALIFVPLGFYSIFAADPEGELVGGIYVMRGTTGYLNDLQQVLVSMTVFCAIVFKWRWYSFIPLAIYIFFRATDGYGRWTMIIPVFAVILFYLWQRRKTFPPLKLLLPLPLVFVLFANLTHDRYYFQNLIEGGESEGSGVTVTDASIEFSERFDTLDFANFDYLTYIVAKVPEHSGTYTYGTQHLQLFTEPIPRKLWPGKPAGAPVSFFNLNDYGNFFGLTTSLVGTGWLSGGWTGTIITLALTGIALGVLANWFFANQNNLFVAAIFIVINALLVQLFRDGSIVSVAKFLLFTLMPVFAWHWLSQFMTYRRLKKEGMEDEGIEGALS